MGWRFQKRIKIAPGITINLSKSGISASAGPRGAKLTAGHGKIRTTYSAPGTGISHTTIKKSGSATAMIFYIIAVMMLLWFFS